MLQATRENIQSVVDLLNDALEKDPKSIQTLFGYRAGPVTDKLADHPTIQIRSDSTVGLIGIINGLFCDPSTSGPGKFRVVMVTLGDKDSVMGFQCGEFPT